MRKFISHIIVIFIATFIVVKYLHLGLYSNIIDLALFSAVLAIFNGVLKPIFKFIALPITCLTFGIFSLVINVLVVMLADKAISGVRLDGFVASAILAILIAIITLIFNLLFRDDD